MVVAVRGSVCESAEDTNHDNRRDQPQHNRKTSAQKSAKRRKYQAEKDEDQQEVHDAMPPIIPDASVIVAEVSRAV